MRIVSEGGDQLPGSEASGPLRPELQFARCMSNRYRSEQFPRCVSCTRRWAGDTCRFQGIRFFLKDAQQNLVGISFVESQKADAPTMIFPNKWNVTLQPSHIGRIKVSYPETYITAACSYVLQRTIARALLPTLVEESKHLNMPEIIHRLRESEVRATCGERCRYTESL
jgi:lysine-specific demethylase 3